VASSNGGNTVSILFISIKDEPQSRDKMPNNR
jgi:hypothetical protein